MPDDGEMQVSTNPLQEDLSKLKVTRKWADTLMMAGLTGCVVLVILMLVLGERVHSQLLASLIICAIIGVVGATYFCKSYTLCWWKNGETGRVTRVEYPETATGLVIRVFASGLRSTVQVLWGKKGWKQDPDGGNYWVSLGGEKLWAGSESEATRAQEGLTPEVTAFLNHVTPFWTIVPLDGGRVLRLVDARGQAGDVRWEDFTRFPSGVDLEAILRCNNWREYHAAVQRKARAHDEANDLMYNRVLTALGISRPMYEETLVQRLRVVEAVGKQLLESRDSSHAMLAEVLPALRQVVKHCRVGTQARIVALRKLHTVLEYLERVLPKESELRSRFDIATDEIALVRGQIDEAVNAPTQSEA